MDTELYFKYTLIRKKISILFLAGLYAILFPTIILILAPIYIYRFLIKASAKYFHPELGSMVSARSMMFAVDDFTKEKSKCTILTSFTVEGDFPDVHTFRRMVQEKLIACKHPSKGHLLFPEFQQQLVHWMGFIFWRNVEKFDIKNHVKNYDDENNSNIVNDEMLKSIEKKLVSKQFEENRSPWEFLLIKNCQLSSFVTGKAHTVVMLRIHHTLCDGFAILDVMSRVISQKITTTLPTFPKKSRIERLTSFISFLFRVPYERIYQSVECTDPPSKWHPISEELSQDHTFAISKYISIQDLKKIKNHFRTSFTSVLFAAIAGGIRQTMLKKGEKIPEKIHCVAPFPVPEHPKDELCNYMTAAVVRLPVGLLESVARLKNIHNFIQKKRNSTAPGFAFMMIPLVGSLLYPMVKRLAKYNMTTSICSNFAGPNTQLTNDFGWKLVDCHFSAGLLVGTLGVGFMIVSCNGKLRIVSRVNCKILEQDSEAEQMMEYIEDEIQILKKCIET